MVKNNTLPMLQSEPKSVPPPWNPTAHIKIEPLSPESSKGTTNSKQGRWTRQAKKVENTPRNSALTMGKRKDDAMDVDSVSLENAKRTKNTGSSFIKTAEAVKQPRRAL